MSNNQNSAENKALTPANLSFNEHGTPVAKDFDDVYFSNDNGLQETEFVFLKHNNLPERWKTFNRDSFVIAETGFGTGLNFLVAWQHFLASEKSNSLQTLHFISYEKFPIEKAQLSEALKQWPQLAELANKLLALYPPLVTGIHRLDFGGVILDLCFEDVNQALEKVKRPAAGLIDCWFLDGFAPSKNPDMWTDNLFHHMTRLAKPQATFATFTAAGFVKRGLAAAGFEVAKPKGFGHKRNMLKGQLAESFSTPIEKQAYYARDDRSNTKTATLIGGGLASANLAYALAKRGYNIQIICKDSELAQGASGNHIGGFYPLIHAEHDVTSQLYTQAFLYARREYQKLYEQGYEFAHDWCGTLQVAYNDKTRQRLEKINHNPVLNDYLVKAVEPDEASELAGLEIPHPSLTYPLAGWINPPSLVKALIKAADELTQVEIITEQNAQQLTQTDSGWVIQTDTGESNADLVVITNGERAAQFGQTQNLPFAPVRGQVTLVDQPSAVSPLKTVLCHKGYLTPGWQDKQCLGSSFVKQTTDISYSDTEQENNLLMLQKCFPEQDWAKTLEIGDKARAGVRCTTPDHLPVAGAVPNHLQQVEDYQLIYKYRDNQTPPANHKNLFILAGLGSRGLCSGALMAEVLACQISGQPQPLNQQLLDAVNPNRFLIRNLIRQKHLTQ